MLKYARANGCPWNEWVCVRAAENDNLEILKYAHRNGCPWSVAVCEDAVGNNNL